jgi:hypothetical protein
LIASCSVFVKSLPACAYYIIFPRAGKYRGFWPLFPPLGYTHRPFAWCTLASQPIENTGKGGPGTVYYENPIESKFILGGNEIAALMNRILPLDYMNAAYFIENLVVEVQPPPRGERCHAAMLKQDLKALLIPKLPLSEKNIEMFKCANKMLQASENGYIERSFIVYTEQMEELTGNTGKWRAYGDLARPYIGLYRDEWPSGKKSSEFRKAFL